MSKNQWIITAVIVLTIVTVLSIYYVPRKLERVMELPDAAPAVLGGQVEGDVAKPIRAYKTDDAQEMAAFVSCLRELRVTYMNSSSAYRVGEVSADVTMNIDGKLRIFFLSDNGIIRYNDKNYKCNDPAAVKDLLTQIQSWTQTTP